VMAIANANLWERSLALGLVLEYLSAHTLLRNELKTKDQNPKTNVPDA